MWIRFLGAVVVSGLTQVSLAGESALERWLSWDGLQGTFTQYEYDANQQLSRTSQGEMTLQRPNFALWRILEPDPQSFYASATGVWHHDTWLETAKFHALDSDGEQATVALFSGDIERLRQRYLVQESEGGLQFTPLAQDSQIESIAIRLTKAGYPERLELRTTLGHRTVIDIENITLGEFSSELFDFTPPPGTEIQ